ncbi:hypothetical protein [Streptomyces sp. NPDC058045]|uniref:hypothetical protein n=1 Tax=Streptomyces sp. NPDC058045 TaxID=3346311 RepID=UPI0036E1E474
MTTSIPQVAAAQAMTDLLTNHPELRSLSWEVATNGVLTGRSHDATDAQAVEQCAALMGGTIRTSIFNSLGTGERRAAAQLATVWRGVTVGICVTYPAPLPSLDAESLRQLLAPAAAVAGGQR